MLYVDRRRRQRASVRAVLPDPTGLQRWRGSDAVFAEREWGVTRKKGKREWEVLNVPSDTDREGPFDKVSLTVIWEIAFAVFACDRV